MEYMFRLLRVWILIFRNIRIYLRLCFDRCGYLGKDLAPIVFFQIRSFSPFILFFEYILANVVRARGRNAYVVIDDGVLLHHDTAHINDEKNSVRFYRLASRIISKLLKRNNIFKCYSDFISDDLLVSLSSEVDHMLENQCYIKGGLDLSEYIESSLIRFFKTTADSLEEEERLNLYRKQFVYNALLSLYIADKIYRSVNPARVVMSHGIYSTWGPIYAFFKSNEVEVVTYDFDGFSASGVNLSQNGLVASRDEDGAFEELVDSLLKNNSIEKNVNELMIKRKKGLSADRIIQKVNYHDNEICHFIRQRTIDKPTFALFTNVLWDASIINANKVFSNQESWIYETIDFFLLSDNNLVIRLHPSEAVFMKPRVSVLDNLVQYFIKHERPLKEEIKGIFRSENIFVIAPGASVSSYELFGLIDCGLVYNGTIGLELAFEEKPVIVAGKAPYSEKGIFADIESKVEYFSIIKDYTNPLYKWDRERLVCFIYFYFYIYSSQIFFIKSVREQKFKYLPSLNEVLDDPIFSRISDIFINKDSDTILLYRFKIANEH